MLSPQSKFDPRAPELARDITAKIETVFRENSAFAHTSRMQTLLDTLSPLSGCTTKLTDISPPQSDEDSLDDYLRAKENLKGDLRPILAALKELGGMRVPEEAKSEIAAASKYLNEEILYKTFSD